MSLARSVLFVLVLGGCGADGGPRGAGPDHAPDAFARGAYSVGVRTVQITRDQRKLRVELWYPATLGEGDAERDEIDLLAEAPDDVRATLQAAGLKSQPLLQRAARDADVHAADRAAGFPVVLFSHGNAGSRVQSHFLATHLASHGYVALDGAGHLSFTNMCGDDIAQAATIIGAHPVMLAGIEDGCGPKYRDPDEVFRLTDGYAAAWLAIYLRDSEDSARWLREEAGVELRLQR